MSCLWLDILLHWSAGWLLLVALAVYGDASFAVFLADPTYRQATSPFWVACVWASCCSGLLLAASFFLQLLRMRRCCRHENDVSRSLEGGLVCLACRTLLADGSSCCVLCCCPIEHVPLCVPGHNPGWFCGCAFFFRLAAAVCSLYGDACGWLLAPCSRHPALLRRAVHCA